MWAVPIAMAAAGALAGSMKDKSRSTVDVAPENALEQLGGKTQTDMLNSLTSLTNLGPGERDITSGLNSQRDLASLLAEMVKTGGMPSQADYTNARSFTDQVFSPERTALNQNFQQAQIDANRAAARMGRGGNDPILLNKLLQEKTRQQQMLDSNMTSFFAQQAQAMPGQRLNLAGQLAQVNSGLASQAMANRQALFSLGSQIKQQEQNFRLGTATRESESGGGMKGALQGGIAGFGAGMGGMAAMGMGGLLGNKSPGGIVANPDAGSQPGLGIGSLTAPQPPPSSLGMNYSLGQMNINLPRYSSPIRQPYRAMGRDWEGG